METKKIVMGVISVAVAIIVLMSMIPIFTDAGASEDTFKNEGNGQYAFISGEDTYTLEWKYSDPTNVIVNGVTVAGVPGNESIAMGDFTVRIQPSATGYAQLILANNESGITANASDQKDFTFSYSDGTVTVTNGTTTKSFESDGFYAIVSDEGTHTMKSTTSTAYIKETDELLVMGITNVGTQWNTGYMVEGTVTDYEVSQWTGTNSYTPTNITDDSTKINGYKDLYSIKQFQWTIDNSGTSQTVTYNYFLVPIEVTAERSVHASPVESTLIGLIPLLMMVGIMLTAVGLFIAKYRKN